jgi:hypothetical protein
MRIHVHEQTYDFWPWKPALGRVFGSAFAFDCETTRIDEEHPWVTPAYVIGAAFDGQHGYFVPRDRLGAFLVAQADLPILMHHAAFDLEVIHLTAPELAIYDRVENNLVWDTQLLHRLYVLGTKGHTASRKGESSLERCTKEYLDMELPKDTCDSKGNQVRLSYGRWLNRPLAEIEPVYLTYLCKDAVATFLVYEVLQARLQELLDSSHGVWGYVSPKWMQEQMQRWGPQTHHIQLRASIVLRQITANGLHLDTHRHTELVQNLEAVLQEKRKALRRYGYLPGQKGSQKALQATLNRLEQRHPEFVLPHTETGQYTTKHDVLQEFADTVPFVQLLLEYRATEKLSTSFVSKMAKPALHPSFNVLARTGRTTSFGEINAQNLPTDDRVRSCFIPQDGGVFLNLDYATVELATLAQACLTQFGLDAQMAHVINARRDVHTLVAARVTDKPENEVTPKERKQAKPINFGKPGGMGDRTLKEYAKASYGITLTDEQVAALSRVWFDLFPEMRVFLKDSTDTGEEVAKLFGLTPVSHFDHTGDYRFLNHPANHGREDRPHPILGGMCLKVLRAPHPQLLGGNAYSPSDIDFFWSRVEACIDLLPEKLHPAVRQRQPSLTLRQAVLGLVGRAGVFTLTGRLRAKATYCARRNSIFQGLAADGAKVALWLMWRAGYRIVNFIHDEVLIEVPAGSNLKCHAERIRRLMIQGMQMVVPDVYVDVKYAATDRWHKDAQAVFDNSGKRLLVWRLRPEKKKKRTAAEVS